MGVIYVLVCVRSYESNLPTNICLTVGKKTQWCREKFGLLSENTFLPYFLTVWCVFFYQSVCFLLMVFIIFLIATLCFNEFNKTVLVKYTPCQGMIWFSLPNAISVTLAFMWYLTYTIIKSPIKLQNNMKKLLEGTALKLPPGLTCPRPCEPVFWKMTSQPTCFCCA